MNKLDLEEITRRFHNVYEQVAKEKNKEYIELTCRFRETCNDIKNKDKEIERLNNIRNKAINFLKENACIDEDVKYFCDDLRYDDCKKLLEILEGSAKE